jgi:hypothetical protein
MFGRMRSFWDDIVRAGMLGSHDVFTIFGFFDTNYDTFNGYLFFILAVAVLCFSIYLHYLSLYKRRSEVCGWMNLFGPRNCP